MPSGRLFQVGDKFGNLTLISPATSKITPRGYQYFQWNCHCDCGINLVIRSKDLSKRRKSCGCLTRLGRFKSSCGNKLTIIERLMKRYQYRAKVRNLCFELSVSQFILFIFTTCHYCKSPPLLFFNNLIRKSEIDKYPELANLKYNGIDRKNSNLGYTLTNAVPCCYICNRAKSDMSYEDFFRWIKNVK